MIIFVRFAEDAGAITKEVCPKRGSLVVPLCNGVATVALSGDTQSDSLNPPGTLDINFSG
jgi:hypothetical protein